MSTNTQPTYIGQIHPPNVTAISELRAVSVPRAQRIFSGIIVLVIGVLIVYWVSGFVDWKWFSYAGNAAVLGFIIWGLMGEHHLHRASCPCCNYLLGGVQDTLLSPKDKKLKLSCNRCLEDLISDGGSVRSVTEEEARNNDRFESGCFKNSAWPNECIVCGAPPTRRLNARSMKFNAGALLIGSISVSSARVTDIPYCAAHEDAVDVKTVDKKVRLLFDDYAALRRYLYVNRVRLANAMAELRRTQAEPKV